MTVLQGVILFVAALLGGGLNSVAGGGSFISFPALFFIGVPPVNANATSTVALWPGSVASTGAYRRELAKQPRVLLIALGIPSLIGGILGAQLLLNTPQAIFTALIPYLLLAATLLFTFSGQFTAFVRGRRASANPAEALPVDTAPATPALAAPISFTPTNLAPTGVTPVDVVALRTSGTRRLVVVALVQLVIATYGGYFGGGIGILMLASLSMMGLGNIHQMNALKTLLASVINGVAVLLFAIQRAVFWPEALLMVVGAIVGGYGGAYYARKLDPKLVRGFVIVVAFSMTIYFFLNAYVLHFK